MSIPSDPARLSARKYMTRFQCIADRCEDTCCSGLGIFLTTDELIRLRRAVKGSEELTRRMERGVEKTGFIPPSFFAVLNRPGQSCTFLGENKLCTIIGEGRSEGLPPICATYPRRFALLADGTTEVGASVSCPEIARLGLLVDDALELTPASPSVSEHYPSPPLGLPPAWEQVRAWGDRRLRDRGEPLPARLLALADLAGRDPDRAPAGAGEVLAAADSSERRAELARMGSGDFQAGLRMVWMMLGAKGPRNERFLRIVGAALAGFDAEVGSDSWEVAQATFLRRRQRAAAAFGTQLDVYLERFCVNEWGTLPYPNYPSLASHALQLTASAALIRFLWLTHPAIDALARDIEAGRCPGASEGEPRARLEAAVVEGAQVVARRFERWRGMFELLEEYCTPQAFGGGALEPVAQFARMCG